MRMMMMMTMMFLMMTMITEQDHDADKGSQWEGVARSHSTTSPPEQAW